MQLTAAPISCHKSSRHAACVSIPNSKSSCLCTADPNTRAGRALPYSSEASYRPMLPSEAGGLQVCRKQHQTLPWIQNPPAVLCKPTLEPVLGRTPITALHCSSMDTQKPSARLSDTARPLHITPQIFSTPKAYLVLVESWRTPNASVPTLTLAKPYTHNKKTGLPSSTRSIGAYRRHWMHVDCQPRQDHGSCCPA
jgi:hypothetical protein